MKKYLELILGLILIAIAFDLFIYPLKLVIGGTSGIAIIFNHLFGINISLFIAVFYMAMVLLSIIVLGFKSLKYHIVGSILYPIFIELFTTLPSYISLDYTNKLLMYLMASILMGIGSGLIYKNGLLSGGTDTLKKILNEKFKMPMATCSFIIDGIIVISGGFIFGLESVLYAIIILYISSKITDAVMLGISTKKMFYIITNNKDEVKEYVNNNLNCGITEMDSIGGYKSEKNAILMCVISTREYMKLKEKVNEIDAHAFYIITDIYHVNRIGGKE